MLNEFVQIERSGKFGAESWQRSKQRLILAGGCNPRNLNTSVDRLWLQVPQV
jgi:hypothetical protein